jgi:K+-transporting ATPase ATPase C chain
MKNILRPALVVFFVLTLVTGIAYPLVVTGLAQALFPAQAGGSLITRDGKPVGSALIGQNFSDPGTSGAALRPPARCPTTLRRPAAPTWAR